MAAPINPILKCPQCEYANEPERVYCHNCGAKLDRSLLPQVKEAKEKQDQERARRRVKKLTNPELGFIRPRVEDPGAHAALGGGSGDADSVCPHAHDGAADQEWRDEHANGVQ